jgi:hypothetical protein
MNNHNPELPSQKLSLGCAFRRGFFPTKVFFSATTLLDLVVLLTHVGGLTGEGSWCQQLVTSYELQVAGYESLVPRSGNPQPATCNPQPATCNPLRFHGCQALSLFQFLMELFWLWRRTVDARSSPIRGERLPIEPALDKIFQ